MLGEGMVSFAVDDVPLVSESRKLKSDPKIGASRPMRPSTRARMPA